MYANSKRHLDLFCCIKEHAIHPICVSFSVEYTVSQKNMPPNFCLNLHQILTDFRNSFTSALCGKFAVTQLLNIPPHLNCVSTLLEKYNFSKITIIRINIYA